MRKEDIDVGVAKRLVASQFPEWADLPIRPVATDGWDNTTFRLGEELSIRLPSGDEYEAQAAKEHHWLPILGPRLPLAIPEPVALGEPGAGFPRRWSINRWIDGDTATADRIDDLTTFAVDLARFLRVLHALDAAGGPPAGVHNFHRGEPVVVYDTSTRDAITRLGDDVDGRRATAVWDAALASAWERPPVWFHGDVTGSNLIVAEGELRAVIDFGTSAVGDPACDLTIAWTLLTAEAREAFRREVHLDDATWARGRGWALWKALLTMVEERGSGAEGMRAESFGWRLGAPEVVELVLADHDAASRAQIRR